MAISQFKKQKNLIKKNKKKQIQNKNKRIEKELEKNRLNKKYSPEFIENMRKEFIEKMSPYYNEEDFENIKDYNKFMNDAFNDFLKGEK